MQPSDLSRIVTPSDPRIRGGRVAYVRTTIDLDGDRYVREVWLADGGVARRLTAGPGDTAPRWSPDGVDLAFLRSVDAKPAQVAVLAVDGGEAEVVTGFDLGVESLEWSPDGTRMAVVAVSWAEGWGGLDDDERGRRPRRITSVPYRFDGKGWTHDRRRHLWLVDPGGGSEPVCLTPGDFDVAGFAWAPDGSRLAVISDRDPRQGLVAGTDVWEVALDGELTQACARGDWVGVSYRPDGVLHLVGSADARYPNVSKVYRRGSDGSLTDLTGPLDRGVTALGTPVRLVWDDTLCLVTLEDSGSVGVIAVDETGAVRHLVDGRRVVGGFDMSEGVLAFTASGIADPGGLFVDGARIDPPLADLATVDADHFRVKSGDVEVDVWVYLPHGDVAVPALLNIHGGPASQYGFGFFDEFQVYAGAGYGVVACNPRGSSGRGSDFVEAVTGDGWGVVDVADVMAAMEAATARHPRLDTERLGIMGGSYGGFLTAWITSRDHRFRAAIVERALISWTSFAGTSDIAGVFPSDYTGAPYPDGWQVWWDKSPLATAHQVRTPTLVLHAEADHRCPIEQAEQYFHALLRNGTPAELLRFPGEGHEMSRTGTPRHRLERFEAVLDWYGRHLR
ncbi:MAG: S9 family peptidase [Acidimicrobiia bacterium]